MPRRVAIHILVSIGIAAVGVVVAMSALVFLDWVFDGAALWHTFVGGLAAAAVFSLTPKRGIGLVVAIIAALVMAIAPYLDGDDACDGESSCEDNFGLRLRIPLMVVTLGFPAVLGEVVAGRFVRPRLWHRDDAPDARAPHV